jgi:chemotaxis protein methyltransferase CheR
MLESRLQKRLTLLNIHSFKEYCDLLFSKHGQQQEVIHMIDLVTTNKTDFFREPAHFEFLTTQILPEFETRHSGKLLKVWSAGCSSGEEPYTLAMIISEYSEKKGQLFNYTITATDLSTQVLNKAIAAVYNEERVAGIPLQLKRKYFLKSKDPIKKTVRIIPQLRSRVSFERLNFMDDSLSIAGEFDIVFCRNVIIYFDKITQEKVINKLCEKLKPGGYFFLGHSESITNMRVPLEQLKPTVFRKVG